MEELKKKLEGLLEEIKKAKKPRPVSTPPSPVDPEDHPPILSEDEAGKLVGKGEMCKIAKNGQWSLEKAMYFGGEFSGAAGKEDRGGPNRGKPGIQHYEYDTSASHEDNFKQAQEHFKNQGHKFGSDEAGLKKYLVGRKADAAANEKKD